MKISFGNMTVELNIFDINRQPFEYEEIGSICLIEETVNELRIDDPIGELMQAKELDMPIIHMGMELNLDKTLCHFLVAQLQDLEPNVSRKH
jgi:hypothetical protein